MLHVMIAPCSITSKADTYFLRLHADDMEKSFNLDHLDILRYCWAVDTKSYSVVAMEFGNDITRH